MHNHLLHVEGLSAERQGVAILDDISFTLAEGRIVGIIGENGAGKSTLLSALAGELPFQGEVLLEGVSLRSLSKSELVRRGVHYIHQHSLIFSTLTPREALALASREKKSSGISSLFGRLPEEVDRSIHPLLLQVFDFPIRKLSFGQRKILEYALNTLVSSPKLLLLDEVFSGLSPETALWLAARVKEVARSGASVIIVEHDAETIRTLCQQTFLLENGRLKETSH